MNLGRKRTKHIDKEEKHDLLNSPFTACIFFYSAAPGAWAEKIPAQMSVQNAHLAKGIFEKHLAPARDRWMSRASSIPGHPHHISHNLPSLSG